MRLRNALLVATVLTVPAVALAQPVTGVYIGVGVGVNHIREQAVPRETLPALGIVSTGNSNGRLRTDTNIMGSGSIGYGFGNGIRLELEGNYSRNTLGVTNLNGGGHENQYSGFVNALYDFDLSGFGVPLTPYLGVGVGYDQVKFENGRAAGRIPNNPGGLPVFIRDTGTQGNFAAQGIAGVAYNIDAVPGLALTLEGRVSAIPEAQTYKAQFYAPGVGTRITIQTDNTINYSGLVGLRYALFQPPPPPPPAEAAPVVVPQPTRTYLVFFDWDRADLTARARQIVSEAAQASTHVQTTRIEVNGYTDLSGTPAYNQRLSVRRAQNVSAELVRDGVSKSEISIRGFGESNPLVQTAKGVREPQNRRVEIILK